jgi:hypothetical protein
MYEFYDISHVREKLKKNRSKTRGEDGEHDEREAFIQANEWLAKRLGRANTKRRQFIAYSCHREALNKHTSRDSMPPRKVNGDPASVPAQEHSSIGRSACYPDATKSSAAQTKATTIANVDPDAFDYGYDDARSCTTVATSVVDGQYFSGLQVPQLVDYTKFGEHFICPLCRTSQRFNGQKAWR